MRSYDKYRNSKYIQQSDVENSPHKSLLVTIKEVTEENMASDSQPERIKYVIHFEENYKPWAPGNETLGVINRISGIGNVDNWPGTQLVLFIDPNVSFQGKITGGIRCRAPKNQAPPESEVPETPNEDIPF